MPVRRRRQADPDTAGRKHPPEDLHRIYGYTEPSTYPEDGHHCCAADGGSAADFPGGGEGLVVSAADKVIQHNCVNVGEILGFVDQRLDLFRISGSIVALPRHTFQCGERLVVLAAVYLNANGHHEGIADAQIKTALHRDYTGNLCIAVFVIVAAFGMTPEPETILDLYNNPPFLCCILRSFPIMKHGNYNGIARCMSMKKARFIHNSHCKTERNMKIAQRLMPRA